MRNFLIVFNWREGKLDHWRDIDREMRDQGMSPEQARDIYRQYERRFKQSDGYEVVLLGADSIGTVRKTHGHYFGRIETEPFVELLGED